MTANRYAYSNRRDPAIHAVPPHLAPDDAAIDLRSVAWLDVPAIGAKQPEGLRINRHDLSLPASIAKTGVWLRLGLLPDGALALILSDAKAPGAVKRRRDGTHWGGEKLMGLLAAAGWPKGDYALGEKTNGWIATKAAK